MMYPVKELPEFTIPLSLGNSGFLRNLEKPFFYDKMEKIQW